MDLDHKLNDYIYADFDAVEDHALGDGVCQIDLTGYGTLASLSKHNISLFEGLSLKLSDQDELGVIAEAFFDESRIPPNCSGWFGQFQNSDIFEVKVDGLIEKEHLCFSCRVDISRYLDEVGRNYKEFCPHCGASIMFPMEPPEAKVDTSERHAS